MNRLVLALLALIPSLLYAEQASLLSEFQAKHPVYYCNQVMVSAFQYCNSTPWSCDLGNKYKSGHYAWAKEHIEDFKAMRRSPLKVPGIDRSIRELVMVSMAEEMRTPNVPGPFSKLVSACGIRQLEQPAPNNSFKGTPNGAP